MSQQLADTLVERVAPLVGAWIEIPQQVYLEHLTCVAPLVGAWIEIILIVMFGYLVFVAPLVGAWIEIVVRLYPGTSSICRSPRGSVD